MIYTPVRAGQVERRPCPSYIEPCQSTPRCPPKVAATFGKPVERPDPRLRLDAPEVIFLAMKIRCNVMTQQGKETGNGEGFVTISDHFKVDGMPVEGIRQEGDGGVDGYHEENPDDTML